MSTNTRDSSPTPPSISERKQDHIEVCREGSGYHVEHGSAYGFDCLDFVHCALPELSCDEVATETTFLDKTISLPIFISCMTGGSEEGFRANKELARAAQQMNIPIGLGSMRVLMEDDSKLRDFSMREYAPDVPILGNIGAVQLRDGGHDKLQKLADQLELNALVVHLNCGQELFQEGGDRDFRGLHAAIADAVQAFPIPVIVKETGFGIRPFLIKTLLELGVAYVDIAGSGGTNWILVEEGRHKGSSAAAGEFASWGLSTPLVLDTVSEFPGRILASGGLRTGMDIAKSVALGAAAGGMALPFFRAALKGGAEAVCEQIAGLDKVLRSVMVLTGCRTLEELRKTPLLKAPHFEHRVSTLKKIDLPR